MTTNPKSVDDIGGEDKADLVFQLAIDDNNSEKDWVKIAGIVGYPVTPEAAQKWFEAITSPQKRDRWTKKEEDYLRSLIFPKQQLQNEEIYELFKNRSKKAVINKISRLRNDELSISKTENIERQSQPLYKRPTSKSKKVSISNQLLIKKNK